MNIERALNIEGFMEPLELEYLAHVAATRGQIAEIGSWKGRSAIAMAANTNGLIYCVDTWSGHLEASDHFSADCFMSFLKNTREFGNILPIPIESSRAAALFSNYGFSFDAIFIDGRHDYEGIEADILNWRPLLRDGGIFCGHDYGHPDWPDVLRAVDRLVPEAWRVPGTNIWTTEGAA